MKKPTVFALLLIAATSLGACGQKGPLYLPNEDRTPPPTETPGEMPNETVSDE